MSASAVTVLSGLAEGMVDAALARGDEGGMRAFDAALERYRSADALGALSAWRDAARPGAAGRTVDVLKRLDRDLLEGLLDTART